jgi:hypothetical protein
VAKIWKSKPQKIAEIEQSACANLIVVMLKSLFYAKKGIPIISGAMKTGPQNRQTLVVQNCTLTVLCTDFKIYCLLNLIQQAWMGQLKTKLCKNGILSPSLFLLTLCFLCLTQMASAMSFRVSTLSVFALNANGLVYPRKIAHMNTAINLHRPHLFVIFEMKTNLRMGSKLPTRLQHLRRNRGED